MLKAHAFALPFAVFISCKCSCVCRVLCIDDASLALSYHTKPIIHSFAARPLDSVQEELETGADVFARVSQSTLRWFLFPYLLLVKKLRGVSCDGGDEVQSYDELLKVSSDTGNATLRTHTFVVQLAFLVIFQEWESALTLLVEAGNIRDAIPGQAASVNLTWMEGLVYLKAAQASTAWMKRNKWKKKAMVSMKMLRGWLKTGNGNGNIVHTIHLLTAEYSILKGNKAKAEESFKSSISVATTNGFMQDRGLAHELASAYYAAKGDDYFANYHMDNAARSFLDWGATSKVEQLKSKRGSSSVAVHD